MCKQPSIDTLRDGSLEISWLKFLQRENYLEVYIFYVRYSQLEAQL